MQRKGSYEHCRVDNIYRNDCKERTLTALDIELVKKHEIEPGWNFALAFDVRWGELDAYGHVSNRSYIGWCEDVRNAYFRELGAYPFTNDRPGPVLKELGFTYEKPLDARAQVVMTAKVTWMRNTSFRMDFAAWSLGLVGRGHSVCVWIQNCTGKPMTLPDALRLGIAQRDNPQDLRAVLTRFRANCR
jgi:acyl-CoA thioester hydrolase